MIGIILLFITIINNNHNNGLGVACIHRFHSKIGSNGKYYNFIRYYNIFWAILFKNLIGPTRIRTS